MTTAIICIFVIGYALIALENWTKVNKAAVALMMAVFSWTLYYWGFGATEGNVSAFTKALGETSEVLFFLLGAMVIVEVVDTNGGFDFVREKLGSKTMKGLLWKLKVMACAFHSVQHKVSDQCSQNYYRKRFNFMENISRQNYY